MKVREKTWAEGEIWSLGGCEWVPRAGDGAQHEDTWFGNVESEI